jgi:predicted DNA binding CopG/RHH family protein
MKRRSNLAEQLSRVSPKLSEVEPGFRVPKFATEEEEIAWLDANHERLAELTLKHGARVRLVLKEPTKLISLRVPVRDLDRAKQIAGARQENYQSVLKRALRRGLEEEDLSPKGLKLKGVSGLRDAVVVPASRVGGRKNVSDVSDAVRVPAGRVRKHKKDVRVVR